MPRTRLKPLTACPIFRDHLRQLVMTSQAAPCLRRRHDQLEDHPHCGVVRQASQARNSSAVALSGERPRKAAKRLIARM